MTKEGKICRAQILDADHKPAHPSLHLILISHAFQPTEYTLLVSRLINKIHKKDWAGQ